MVHGPYFLINLVLNKVAAPRTADAASCDSRCASGTWGVLGAPSGIHRKCALGSVQAERHKESERERERQKDRKTKRQADGQTDGQTHPTCPPWGPQFEHSASTIHRYGIWNKGPQA